MAIQNICVYVSVYGSVFEFKLEMAVRREFPVPSLSLLKIQAGQDISMLAFMKFMW